MSSVFFPRPQNPPPNLRRGKFPVSSFSAGSAPHPHFLTGYTGEVDFRGAFW